MVIYAAALTGCRLFRCIQGVSRPPLFPLGGEKPHKMVKFQKPGTARTFKRYPRASAVAFRKVGEYYINTFLYWNEVGTRA